jgi:hypothetical protein
MSQTLGAWLRAQRIARKWTIAEMGRQLQQTARAGGDHTVPSCATLAAYVRRWEKGKIGLTERYRLHYCAAFAIAAGQFGPEPTPPLAQESSPPPLIQDGVPAAGTPTVDVSEAGCVVVVIPRCQQIVIDISGAGTKGTADEPQVPPRLVIVKDPAAAAGETVRAGAMGCGMAEAGERGSPDAG